MANEKWKPVQDFEGLYEVSNLGRVRSLPRAGTFKNRMYGGKILNPSTNTHGYLCVRLSKDAKHYRRDVHRLVAQAFIPNPKNLPFVLHKDDDRANPHYKNLWWGTAAENTHDMMSKNRQDFDAWYRKGSDVNTSKLTEAQARKIKKLLAQGAKGKDLAERFGITATAVSYIKTGKNWGWL